MRIFLAGGVSGNLNSVWKEVAHGKGWNEAIVSFLGRNREQKMAPDLSG